MPKTRAARRAAAARQLIELPADVLGLVLYQLPLAHDIAATATTCTSWRDAVRLALLARPFSAEVVALRGHNDWVRSVAATSDGHIITGSDDERLKVFHGETCVRTINAHENYVMAVAVLPCETRIVSGEREGVVKLWTRDGTLERTIQTEREELYRIVAMPDGVHFLVGLCDGEVRLYHIDGTLVHTFFDEDTDQSMTALAVMPDGLHFISGTDHGFIDMWGIDSRSHLWGDEDKGHKNDVLALAAMPDGQRFLSGGIDDTVRVWLFDGTLENTFRHLHDDDVRALVALPDSHHALSGGEDRMIKLFNVNDGGVLRTFTHHDDAVCCLALMPDGRRFISSAWDATARIAEHGLVLEPEQAWVDAKPKREALTAAVAAARTAREMHVSEKMRVDLEANRIELQRQVKVLQGQIAERERQSEQEGQRIERLSALEEEVEAAAGDPARVQEAQARLTAEIGVIGTAGSVPARRRRDLHEYMVQ